MRLHHLLAATVIGLAMWAFLGWAFVVLFARFVA